MTVKDFLSVFDADDNIIWICNQTGKFLYGNFHQNPEFNEDEDYDEMDQRYAHEMIISKEDIHKEDLDKEIIKIIPWVFNEDETVMKVYTLK